MSINLSKANGVLSSTRTASPSSNSSDRAFFGSPSLKEAEGEIPPEQAKPKEDTGRKKRTLSKASCPCKVSSNGKDWAVKCFTCNQAWHLSCANLKGLNNIKDESKLNNLLDQWQCPWCFQTPFTHPEGSEALRLKSSLADNVMNCTQKQEISDIVVEHLNSKLPDLDIRKANALVITLQQEVENLQELKKEVSKLVEVREDISKLHDLRVEMFKSQEVTTEPQQVEPNRGRGRANAHVEPRSLDLTDLEMNPTKHVENYLEGYINEELADQLVTFCASQKYTKFKSRDACTFGEKYAYVGAPKDNKSAIPKPLQELIRKILDDEDICAPNDSINQIIINRYSGKSSSLPEHSDDEASIAPESNVFTLSLGCTRTMQFRDLCQKKDETLDVTHRSLYSMSKSSQYYWTHRMCSEGKESSGEVRYSITFRTVGEKFKNSLVIIGDSNTKYLKFSQGKGEQGTFGYTIPGKRVVAFHIEDIKPSDCLGYQNVHLHCGTNNMREGSPGRKPDDPAPSDVDAHADTMIEKVVAINRLCPYTSITISPMLPTKSHRLNTRARQYNRRLFTFQDSHPVGKLTKCLNFNEFVAENGLLNEEYGTWDQRTKSFSKKDAIHLGRIGVRRLAALIRQGVLNRNQVNGRSWSEVVERGRSSSDIR